MFYVQKSIQWQNPNNKPTDRRSATTWDKNRQNYNSCILCCVFAAKYWSKTSAWQNEDEKKSKQNQRESTEQTRQNDTLRAWNEIVNACEIQNAKTTGTIQLQAAEKRDADLFENCYLFTNVTFNLLLLLFFILWPARWDMRFIWTL